APLVKCAGCGVDIWDTAKFCSACGAPHGQAQPANAQPQVIIVNRQPGSKSSGLLGEMDIVRAIGTVLILVLAGMCGKAMCEEAEESSSLDTPATEPAEPHVAIVIDPSVPREMEGPVTAAVDAFKVACPGWRQHWSDVVSARATYERLDPSHYLAERYAW